MAIKEIFSRLFGHSLDNAEEFIKALKQDIPNAKLSTVDFEKKFKKIIDYRIKKIPSMTMKEKQKENEMISLAFTVFGDFEQIFQVAPPISEKIKVIRPYLKDYQNKLRESIRSD